VSIQHQKGMTMLGMIAALVLVASGLLLAMKILPLYLDDYTIAKALENLQREEGLYELPKSRVLDKFSRKLAGDYSRSFSKDEVIIEKKKDVLTIDVIYETRVPVVYNLDVVAKFSHHFEQKK